MDTGFATSILQIKTPEQFGLDICRTHMDAYDQLTECTVYIDEHPWKRMAEGSLEHYHAFISSPEAIRFTEIQHAKHGMTKCMRREN